MAAENKFLAETVFREILTNRPLTASEVLDLYRARNDVETKFRDLKHRRDWRLDGYTSENAIRVHILISFLALFCMSMIRFPYPEFRGLTAKSIPEELSSFSFTVIVGNGEEKKRIFSNFGRIIRRLRHENGSIPTPKALKQTLIDGFRS
jgi:transposase